ncbi:peptidyl-prolyl cis-trans isomerase, cyclophilin-type domain-containing protein [Toxoplasma gondii ME49]|uniref:Peptidyl-prolyl cis-trans isomerase n=1 Tax=Toxoplasma gondii (strain ATCC 50611 / Me49) TaxID=508771 RepID=S8GFQ1_TOXGM|nr:peptidyl-prolyl cis-trans isomerase, cyclophilin-type domain-containing protein [Toxoplasma gondii ME49]EPT27254.1 peptidyl-prolyl cis-trans isomerase, cyclophilin-type domain-containing protein [Toxoplasma gondii ME49]|eukprot:XP_002366408.1 peptidyl-prolyl cis-trans isomerase, cyclophilin-type domain-containing protein [Toxoplasma gondii ME49]
MAVLLQTTVGEIVIDLLTEDAPFSSYNFLKLSKAKFFNNVAFHRVEKNFLAHVGAPLTADPRWNVAGLKALTKAGDEDRQGCSVWGVQTLLEAGQVALRVPAAPRLPSVPLKKERGEAPLCSVAAKPEPRAETIPSPSSSSAFASSSSPTASPLVGRTSFFSSVDFASRSFPSFPASFSLASAGVSVSPRLPRSARFCPDEGEGDSKVKTRRHDVCGVVGWVPAAGRGADEEGGNSSVFYITLRDRIPFLDERNLTIFGRVAEGFDVLEKINLTFVDENFIPLTPIRILHTFVLDDPFEDPAFLEDAPSSPVPLVEEVGSDDEELDEVLVLEKIEKKEADARKVTLEILGDLPDADAKPPDNVLFVAKLNPVTQDEDLQTVFSRFGDILACDIIRDWKTGRSLQYAFITFRERSACELAYFKMQNVLIDDRRIHVDFSQSVAKEWRKYRQMGSRQKTEEGEKRLSELPQKTARNSSVASSMSRPASSVPGNFSSSRRFSDAPPRDRKENMSGWSDARRARDEAWRRGSELYRHSTRHERERDARRRDVDSRDDDRRRAERRREREGRKKKSAKSDSDGSDSEKKKRKKKSRH